MAKFMLSLLLCCIVAAVPTAADLGVSFENEQDTALLKLDYGTYRGIYNASSDVSQITV